MLEGLLVDLVPRDAAFKAKRHTWQNNEAQFWAQGGERSIMSHAALEHQFQQRNERAQRHGRKRLAFGIRTKDGVPIGVISANRVHPVHRWCVFGAKIGESDYWGGGYGTDALTLIVDYAFDWLDLRRVWLATTGLNARVQRQMEKVGFTLECRQRDGAYADGVWYDELFYGLLRDEWPGRVAMIERLGLRVQA